MTTTESIIMNFEEIRRRSIKLWSGLTTEFYEWRPDIKAQSCIGMIRHVLETENIYRLIIVNKEGNADDFVSPWKDIVSNQFSHPSSAEANQKFKPEIFNFTILQLSFKYF